MKLVSFNINGLRARPHQLSALVEKHQPDVIGFQETKVADEQFPSHLFDELGYHVHFHGQKGHYGVALASKKAPLVIHKGFPDERIGMNQIDTERKRSKKCRQFFQEIRKLKIPEEQKQKQSAQYDRRRAVRNGSS